MHRPSLSSRDNWAAVTSPGAADKYTKSGAWNGLSPLSQQFFTRCAMLGFSPARTKQAVLASADWLREDLQAQLEADFAKLAEGVPGMPQMPAGPPMPTGPDPVESGALFHPKNWLHDVASGPQDLAYNWGPTLAKAVPQFAKNMIPQGVKDWAHTDPHAALRAGNPSPPPDNTGLKYIGMLGAGKALGTATGQSLLQLPGARPLVGALGGQYGGGQLGKGIDEFGQHSGLYDTHGLGQQIGTVAGGLAGGIGGTRFAGPAQTMLGGVPVLGKTIGMLGAAGSGVVLPTMIGQGGQVAGAAAGAGADYMALNRHPEIRQMAEGMAQMQDPQGQVQLVHQALQNPAVQKELGDGIMNTLTQKMGIKPEQLHGLLQQFQGMTQAGGQGLAMANHFADQVLGMIFPPDTVAAMHPLAKVGILMGGLTAILGLATRSPTMGGIGVAGLAAGLGSSLLMHGNPQEGDLDLLTGQPDRRLAEIDLGLTRQMRQRQKDFLARLLPGPDRVLHHCVAALVTMLVPQPLEDPSGRVSLLLRRLSVVGEDLVNDR